MWGISSCTLTRYRTTPYSSSRRRIELGNSKSPTKVAWAMAGQLSQLPSAYRNPHAHPCHRILAICQLPVSPSADSGPQRPVPCPPLPKPHGRHRASPRPVKRNCKVRLYRKRSKTPRVTVTCQIAASSRRRGGRHLAGLGTAAPPHCPPPPLETKPPTPPSTGSTFRGRGRGCSAPQNPRTRRPRRHRPAWHAAGGPPDR